MRIFVEDRGTLEKPKRLPNGILRVDAYLTRAGVFYYRNDDGSIRRELRLPDEVFNDDSLDTLRGTALTMDHPAEPVSLDNVKDLQIGTVGTDIARDGTKVRATLTVTDKASIAKMESGKREVSCGYWADYDPTPGQTAGIPGLPDGLKYDGIQRNIEYNHVAIVDMGRAGPEVAVRMDAANWRCDSVSWRVDNPFAVRKSGSKWKVVNSATGRVKGTHDTEKEAKAQLAALEAAGANKDSAIDAEVCRETLDVSCNDLKDSDTVAQKPPGEAKMFKITIDGVTYELEGNESAQQALTQKLSRDDKAISFEKARADAAEEKLSNEAAEHAKAINAEKARADAAEEKAEKLEKSRNDAASPEAIQKAVNARLALVDTARRVMGDGYDANGKSDDDVKRDVVLKVSPGAKSKLDENDAGYLAARFDQAVEGFGRQANADVRADAADAGGQSDGNGRIGSKLDEAEKKYRQRLDAMWEQPLSASKDAKPEDVTVRM